MNAAVQNRHTSGQPSAGTWTCEPTTCSVRQRQARRQTLWFLKHGNSVKPSKAVWRINACDSRPESQLPYLSSTRMLSDLKQLSRGQSTAEGPGGPGGPGPAPPLGGAHLNFSLISALSAFAFGEWQGQGVSHCRGAPAAYGQVIDPVRIRGHGVYSFYSFCMSVCLQHQGWHTGSARRLASR